MQKISLRNSEFTGRTPHDLSPGGEAHEHPVQEPEGPQRKGRQDDGRGRGDPGEPQQGRETQLHGGRRAHRGERGEETSEKENQIP